MRDIFYFATKAIFLLLFCCGTLYSQQSFVCGASKQAMIPQYEKLIKDNLNLIELSGFSKQLESAEDCIDEEALITLPVVFHLVHSPSTPLGQKANMTNATIINMLSDVNDDFSHASGMTYANPYSGVNTKIQFKFAVRDPNGNATNGIVRHSSSAYSNIVNMSPNEQAMMNAYHWNTNKYINIYVFDNMNNSGFARFPSTHGNVLDGVLMKASSFQPQVVSHELGHYLGLYHTFDPQPPVVSAAVACDNSDCLMTGDRVCDTPPKRSAGTGGAACNSPGNSCTTDEDDTSSNNPFRPIALGGLGDQVDAIENYMDYTGGCMTSFTHGQRDRMRSTLFGIRQSLLSSDACTPVSTQEVAINEIIYPSSFVCGSSGEVIVELENLGTATLTSFPIEVVINGVVVKTYNWSGNIAAGAKKEVTIPDVTFPTGENKLEVTTNWSSDGYFGNNTACTEVELNAPTSVCQLSDTDFEAGFNGWSVSNPDNINELELYALSGDCAAPSCADHGTNVLAYLSKERPSVGSGGTEEFLTQSLNLTEATNPSLSFDYAHRATYGNFETVLDVEVSTDCGQSFAKLLTMEGSYPYEHTSAPLSGKSLASVPYDKSKTTESFFPTKCSDWKTKTVDLSAYEGQVIQFRFRVMIESGWSQNLFIDNIELDKVCTGTEDCAGVVGGTALIDGCGVCSGGTTGRVPGNTCTDCAGVANGTAYLDKCGVCVGGTTCKDETVTCLDCNGDPGGAALIDDCGVCAGGLTGEVPNASCEDCNGDVGGGAVIDLCGNCVGGSSGNVEDLSCLDCNGDPNGGAEIDQCGECTGGLTGIVINSSCIDCAGVNNGTASVDACGVCAGGGTGVVPNESCKDCAGVPNGTAAIDACGDCSGGTTGLVVDATCTDCNGDVNGTAEIDACGLCTKGATGLIYNASCTDCSGVVNGTASIDACGDCTGGTTGKTPDLACSDCNGDVNGTAFIDGCGTCAAGNTGVAINSTCSDCDKISPIQANDQAFCTNGSQVTLEATSLLGGCSNIRWYGSASGGSPLGSGCTFVTPPLSNDKNYFVEDVTFAGGGVGELVTGYDFTSSNLSTQQNRWNEQYKVEFTVTEQVDLKSFQVKFSNCNHSNSVRVVLQTGGQNGPKQYHNQTISCQNNKVVTITPNFVLNPGVNYRMYFDNATNKEIIGFQNRTGSFSSYFDSRINIISAGDNGNGYGPFFNWKILVPCTRKKVVVKKRCLELCGNGIDDDGDGDIDEACVPFSCEGKLFQSLSDTLYDISLSPASFNPIANFPFSINATAYNPMDNYVYAMIKSGTHDQKIVRIDGLGNYEPLLGILNESGQQISSFSGDIGQDGYYYVYDNSANPKVLYKVNLTTLLGKSVATSTYSLADIAYNPSNGKLYGLASGSYPRKLIELDPVSGASTNLGNVTITGIAGSSSGGIGAVYFTPTGEMLAYGAFSSTSTQDDMIRIDLDNLTGEVLLENSIPASENDGASCPYSVAMEKTASVNSISGGQKFEYTIDVFNNTGFVMNNVDLIDTLDSRLKVSEIISNGLGQIKSGTGAGYNTLYVENFSLLPGVSTIKFEVEVDDIASCELDSIPNQAILQGLPLSLGVVIYSDDPSTLKQLDTTWIDLSPNLLKSVDGGILSPATAEGCGLLDLTVQLNGHNGNVNWYESDDQVNWSPFAGGMLDDSTLLVSYSNAGSTTINKYLRAEVYSECDTQYVDGVYTIHPEVTVSLEGVGDLDCTTSSVDLTATSSHGGVGYSWSDGGSTTSASRTVTDGGLYKVTILDPTSGCEASDSIEIVKNDAPPTVILAVADSIKCSATTVEIEAIGDSFNGSHSYEWVTIPGQTSSDAVQSVTSSAWYTVTVTDDLNNCTVEGSVFVELDTLRPNIESLIALSICANDKINLNTLQYADLNNVLDKQVSFVDEFGVLLSDQSNTTGTSDYRFGIYALNTDNDCDDTHWIDVEVLDKSAVDMSFVPICEGEQMEIVLTNGPSNGDVILTDGTTNFPIILDALGAATFIYPNDPKGVIIHIKSVDNGNCVNVLCSPN